MHSQSKLTCGLNILQKGGPTKLTTGNQQILWNGYNNPIGDNFD